MKYFVFLAVGFFTFSHFYYGCRPITITKSAYEVTFFDQNGKVERTMELYKGYNYTVLESGKLHVHCSQSEFVHPYGFRTKWLRDDAVPLKFK